VELLSALTDPATDDLDWLRLAGEQLSLAGLRDRAAAVASRIAGASAVAVSAQPDASTVVAVVAGLLAGVPVVPLPPDSGPAELRHLLTDSGAELLVADQPPAALAAARVRIPMLPPRGVAGGTVGPEPAPETIALILYTSGTTGRPKGVLVPRAAIAANLDALADAWAWTAGDTLVHGLPLYHVHGLVLGVLGALRVGSRLIHTGRPAPHSYAVAGGSLYFGVPTVWSRIAADPGAARALAPARLLVSGSAPLPPTLFATLRDLTGHELIERYGMTETLITVSARADGPRRAGQVGWPLAGVRTRLIHDDVPAPADASSLGELEVRSPSEFAGYLHRPDASAAAYTPDGWFRTGDVATIDADGAHRIVGRANRDLIKSGGFRIGAGEVEDALLAHPSVREAAVVGAPHPDLGQEIVAYVVGEPVDDAELIDFVARTLSIHKRPRRVVRLTALPRNPMGKIQKHELG
jgi:fatty acid CoA ligase FadD36